MLKSPCNMKLLYKSEKYLRHARRVARRSLKRGKKTRRTQRVSRREQTGLSKQERKLWHTKRRYKAIIKAPVNCAFLDDPNGVAAFIERVEVALISNPSLYVEMNDVEKLDYATIASLFTVLELPRKKGKKINGSMPKNDIARLTLAKSGFIDTLFSGSPEVGHKHEISADNQLFTLDKRDLDVVREIENAVSQKLLDKQQKLPGLYTTIGELMDNTATHAAKENDVAERWWISINHNREEKRVEFVFVDYGVGIFTSLKTKKPEQGTARAIWDKALETFGLDAAGEHLKAIVTQSARKIYQLPDGRGQGIYGIYQAMKRGEIGNLHIVSNNAFGAVSQDRYKKLKNELRGTLYYWDVCAKNYQ